MKRFTFIRNKKFIRKVITFGIFIFVAIIVGVGVVKWKFDFSSIVVDENENFETIIDSSNRYIGYIENAETDYIKLYTEKNGEYVMSVPWAIVEPFPANNRNDENYTFGWLDFMIFYCGEIGDFRWVVVATNGVMSASHTNVCTSNDGGENWYVDSNNYMHEGIVDNAWFVSETEGYITYSGGGNGKGISKTVDGGRTWEHKFGQLDELLSCNNIDISNSCAKLSLQAYQDVLENKNTIYISSLSQNKYISDLLTVDTSISKYTITDLDNDRDPEVILKLCCGTNENYGLYVLRYFCDTVYLYDFPYRGLNQLKVDGTFSWSGGVSYNGISRINFDDNKYTQINLAYCENDIYGNVNYYIGNESASLEDYFKFQEDQDHKQDAVWYEYTIDEFKKSVVSFESNIEENKK